MVSEHVRAVQYGNPQLQDVCQVYGSITCKVSCAWVLVHRQIIVSIYLQTVGNRGDNFDGTVELVQWILYKAEIDNLYNHFLED